MNLIQSLLKAKQAVSDGYLKAAIAVATSAPAAAFAQFQGPVIITPNAGGAQGLRQNAGSFASLFVNLIWLACGAIAIFFFFKFITSIWAWVKDERSNPLGPAFKYLLLGVLALGLPVLAGWGVGAVFGLGSGGTILTPPTGQ